MSKVIAIDFDGTCVTNEYPKIGKTVPGCLDVLSKLIQKGNRIILFTVRDKKDLTEAIEWFHDNKIELYAINDNPQQKSWPNYSRKIYYDYLIDDRAVGCPLTTHPSLSKKPFVDWIKIEKILSKEGLL